MWLFFLCLLLHENTPIFAAFSKQMCFFRASKSPHGDPGTFPRVSSGFSPDCRLEMGLEFCQNL